VGLTYRQAGDALTLTAPAGGVVSGVPCLVGGLLVVPVTTAAAGEPFVGATAGVFVVAKSPGSAWVEGQRLYWDAATARASTDPALGPPAGVAVEAAGSADTSGAVRLDGTAPPSVLTPEGGLATWLVNKSGAPSVRGTMVTAGGGVTRGAVPVTAGIPNPIGAIYDAAVPDGSLMRVVVAGVAEVLMEDGQAPTVGYWVGTSASANGRAYVQPAPPGGGLPTEIAAHNGEIGHCLETKIAGTDVRALCVLHFN
jgi:predicted RecA/RadA family phage recombinase